MPDLTPFVPAISALGGALIGGGAALLGQWLTWQRQFNLEVLKDRRALQVARRERLQGTYETVLLAATSLQSASTRLIFLLADETAEDRARQVRELLARADDGLDRARVRLMLDRDAATTIYPAFEAVRSFFNELWLLESDKRQGDQTIRSTDIGNKRRELHLGVDALCQAMVDSLAQLDQTIDELAVAMTPAK